jgi:hypothetical protein
MAQREIRVLLERAIDALAEAFRTVLVARLIEGTIILARARHERRAIVHQGTIARQHLARRVPKRPFVQLTRSYLRPFLIACCAAPLVLAGGDRPLRQ